MVVVVRGRHGRDGRACAQRPRSACAVALEPVCIAAAFFMRRSFSSSCSRTCDDRQRCPPDEVADAKSIATTTTTTTTTATTSTTIAHSHEDATSRQSTAHNKRNVKTAGREADPRMKTERPRRRSAPPHTPATRQRNAATDNPRVLDITQQQTQRSTRTPPVDKSDYQLMQDESSTNSKELLVDRFAHPLQNHPGASSRGDGQARLHFVVDVLLCHLAHLEAYR